MSYFTAVIAGDGRAWRARDVDVEDADSLDDLAETLRGVANGEHPVLAVIEHEDEWFALVRVDGDEDARVFVSDFPASSRGPYAELLSAAADVETADGLVAPGDGETAAPEPDAASEPDVAPDPDAAPAPDVDPGPADEPAAAGAPSPAPVPAAARARASRGFEDDEADVVVAEADPRDDEADGGVAELDSLLDEADDDGVVPDVGDLDEPDPLPPPAWAGDPSLLDDLGIDRRRLCTLTEDNTDDPASVLGEIGEQVGFADLLEALR